MKLHAAALLLAASSATANDDGAFRPVRVRYDDLISAPASGGSGDALSSMMDALSDVGMVSVTGLPSSFEKDRRAVQANLGACAGRSGAAREHEFEDGTKRTTLASHTVPGPGGIQKITHGDDSVDACAAFDAAAKPFRARVDQVTRAFAARVAEASGAKSLLATEGGHVFDTFEDVVDSGEHLEHFHVYEKGSADDAAAKKDETIEWHTDQGFLLAFAPGARVDKEGKVDYKGEDDGFLVKLADGTTKSVAFDAEDGLVFMLGDGVEQVVNPALKEDGNARRLRALPHSLRVSGDASTSRVWYGRMVLAPSDAVHPAHGKTFGALRNLLVEEMDEKDSEVHALGCSGDMKARQLEEAQCEPGSTYCWHRCMFHEDHDVSEEICAAQQLDVACINPRYQLYDNSHGDWYPACIDVATAPNATDYDPLPTYPRSDDACTPEAHEAWVTSNAANFQHNAPLPHGGHFYWTVEDDDKVRGMISYDGLFGYLAYGWAGVGDRNEMQQAHVVMAKPSSEYTARYGFDFSYDPAVHLHWIGDDLSHRHWQDPLEDWGKSGQGMHEIVEEDCFTALQFEMTGIHDRAFNITGHDRLMWAANGEDMFAGYHGLARSVFTVNWLGGELDYKCSVAHGIDSCTGERLVEGEEEAELETGLPPVAETDAGEVKETVEVEADDAAEAGAQSAAGTMALAAPVVAVLACLFSLA